MSSGLQREYVVKEGSTVRLVCEATGVPSPSIHWHRPADNNLSDPALVCLLSRLTFSLAITVTKYPFIHTDVLWAQASLIRLFMDT